MAQPDDPRNLWENNDDDTLEDSPAYRPYPPDEDITAQALRVGEGHEEELDENGNLLAYEEEEMKSTPFTDEEVGEDNTLLGDELGESLLYREDIEETGEEDKEEDDLIVDEDEDIKDTYDAVTTHNYDPELDVPGAELDDDMEELGEEDEENNYYSLNDD